MGRPMAERLLAAGHAVHVWARRPDAAAALIAQGACWCASPRELGAACEVVITVVTNGADVAAVTLGGDGLAEGLIAGLAPDSVVVDMSTIPPAEARRIAGELGRRGVHLLDAPVSGGAVGAQAGTLAIMVGGEAAIVERVRPLFEVLGRTLVHVGPSGAGQVAKACNQMVMVAMIQSAAEAFALVAASGVDGARAREAMLGGSAGSRVMEVFGGRMVDANFAAGVESRLHHKDYAIIIDEAQARNIALPLGGLVMQSLNALMAAGMGHDDTSSLFRLIAPEGASGR